MPSSYKTPGVYVEEVSKFPPSVAPVATAIPAFIGYTEKAEKNGESLINKPTKVRSFVEFEQFFGGPPARDVIIRLSNGSQFSSVEPQSNTFLLYDCLRHFYQNGGGDCYIASVGDYSAAPNIGSASSPQTGILGGLKALEKYDEPTILVCPDATLLGTGMYTYQQQALAQCAKLQDRVLVGDVFKSNDGNFFDNVADLRNRIGINNLKYGAIYAPWLRSTLSAGLRYRDVLFALGANATDAATSRGILFGLSSDSAIRQLVFDLENAISAATSMENELDPDPGTNLVGSSSSLENELRRLMSDFEAVTINNLTDIETPLGAVYNYYVEILLAINSVFDTLPSIVSVITSPSTTQTIDFKLSNDIADMIPAMIQGITRLATHHQQINEVDNAIELITTSASLQDVADMLGLPGPVNDAGDFPSDSNIANSYYATATLSTLESELSDLADAAAVDPDPIGTIQAGLPGDLAMQINDVIAEEKALAPADVATLITNIENNANVAYTDLARAVAAAYVGEQLAANGSLTVAGVTEQYPTSFNQHVSDALSAAQAADAAGGNATAVSDAIRLTFDLVQARTALAADGARQLIETFAGYFMDVLSAAQSYESTFDSSLKDVFGAYKTLLNRANQELMVLPASAAMAGIYTFVDNTRGVWKAPANVSLSSVSGPNIILNAEEQADLNVDVNAGKSINIIRSFTGKGTLVWGARTLAGNDNEWRYISVRRFFNFAEESIKKATEQFVFEPNDANTWVRVKAMIENFLILQWRAGALAGAKPEQAFFVKVGLGETMTSLDILEGRMIVEIGMAVVRPAEFIILRFSHKMQEA